MPYNVLLIDDDVAVVDQLEANIPDSLMLEAAAARGHDTVLPRACYSFDQLVVTLGEYEDDDEVVDLAICDLGLTQDFDASREGLAALRRIQRTFPTAKTILHFFPEEYSRRLAAMMAFAAFGVDGVTQKGNFDALKQTVLEVMRGQEPTQDMRWGMPGLPPESEPEAQGPREIVGAWLRQLCTRPAPRGDRSGDGLVSWVHRWELLPLGPKSDQVPTIRQANDRLAIYEAPVIKGPLTPAQKNAFCRERVRRFYDFEVAFGWDRGPARRLHDDDGSLKSPPQSALHAVTEQYLEALTAGRFGREMTEGMIALFEGQWV